MGIYSIDPQLIGWQEDRSGVGLLRNKPTVGNIVPVPFRYGGYESTVVGSGSSVTFTWGGYGSSMVPHSSGLLVTVPAAVSHGARIQTTFYGPIFGLHVQRDCVAGRADDRISVLIDGEAYPLRRTPEICLTQALSGWNDMAGVSLLVDDLPDLPGGRPHFVEIAITCHPTIAITSLLLSHLFLDGRYYRDATPAATRYHTFVPSSETQMFSDSASSAIGTGVNISRNLRKILFHNKDTVTRTVTIKDGAGEVFKVLTLSAGADGEFDPGIPFCGSMIWSADAANVVRAVCFVIQ